MHIFQTILAFGEGLALIASPCILPVLPLVLSASAEGGRKRPFGIILGFAIAFTLFALLSRKLVSAFHIDLDVIKYASLVLLFGFGLVMLSTRLSERFSALTQGAATIGNNLAGTGQGGFGSGVLIGALIGLVWTPCAGPILAAVLVQIIREQSDAGGFLLIFAFALGAGMPMLAIALTGRKIMGRLGFFTTHADRIRKAVGVIMIASVFFIAAGGDIQSLLGGGSSASSGNGAALEDGLASPYPAPELAGIEGWINSKPLTMSELKGKVVLIDFWTYSCINCVRTLPHITEWDKKYRDKGLVIIGVHAPEFEFEKNLDNVKTAVAKYGIHYPVALDSTLATWAQFNNQYWPAHYLVDKDGKVVYTHFGEGNYDVTENNIRYLLGLKDTVRDDSAAGSVFAEDQSPETYLGFARAERFAGPVAMVYNALAHYRFPVSLPLHNWALEGTWKTEPDKIVSGEGGSVLRFHFKAGKVFLVLGNATGTPLQASILLNGNAVGASAGKDTRDGTLNITGHALYELIDQKKDADGVLELRTNSPGLEAYAFTFGG